MPDWGVTDEGYYRPLFPEVRQYVDSTYRGRFGANINTDHHTPDGNMVDWVAELLTLLYEDDEATYQTAFLDTVDGTPFDLWLASRGFRRREALQTEVWLEMQGDEGTLVEAASQVRAPATDEVFELMEDHTITDPYSIALFRAVNTGPILANVDDGWEIVTTVTGWDGVGNPQDEETGNDLETVADAKGRYVSAIQGGTVKRELLKLPGVRTVRVFENDTDIPDPIHDATHWLEALVVGGDDQEIVNTIARFKAPGVGTRGDTSGVETVSGEGRTILFSRGTPVPVYVAIAIAPGEGWPSTSDELRDQIRTDMVTWATGAHEHGNDVAPDMFRGQISSIVPGARYSATVFVGLAPSPTDDEVLEIDDRDVATFTFANVEVTFV